jgi:hypothetical protein
LRDENKLQVFRNGKLRKIFKPNNTTKEASAKFRILGLHAKIPLFRSASINRNGRASSSDGKAKKCVDDNILMRKQLRNWSAGETRACWREEL